MKHLCWMEAESFNLARGVFVPGDISPTIGEAFCVGRIRVPWLMRQCGSRRRDGCEETVNGRLVDSWCWIVPRGFEVDYHASTIWNIYALLTRSVSASV